ncbi:ribosome maturation factor RimP [Myxococcota bacterium]|nr:ribosome maturation factor RimP [Myxococcota bacterium]MBU1381096.1 ribosome maturation factor RimP [Myxococcota bacterium]MBU1498221.1 ribosome maturation factor RimP [Myxococcota bacterium]
MKNIDDKLHAITREVVDGCALELWGMEWTSDYGRRVLRVYIDSSTGVGLDSCVNVSKLLSARLDVEDIIQTAYSLEVSSPGLERPLFAPEHFRKYTGKKVRFKLARPLEGSRRNYTATVNDVSDNGLEVTFAFEGKVLVAKFEDISSASLVFEDENI